MRSSYREPVTASSLRYDGTVDIVRAPENIPDTADLFLAGGISGCPDWQEHAERRLVPVSGLLINPRRYGHLAPEFEAEQVTWEHEALRASRAILFWFPKETLCPITLFELGAWSMTNKPLFVAVHPEYQRRENVLSQLRLARPDVAVVDSLDEVLTLAEAALS
jgi:hypothetical protein